MLFKNETAERIKYPTNSPVSDWITVRPGEHKEIKDEKRALAHGLTPVKAPVKDADGEPVGKAREEVKAEESSVGKEKVETKQLKAKKSKKRNK